MFVEEYSNHWDNEHGYTMEEALLKKAKVDDAHDVSNPNSRWEPAEIVPDQSRHDGYKVIIKTK